MPHSNRGGIVGRFSSSSSVGGNDDDDDDGGGEEIQWEMEMSPLDMPVTTKGAWGGLWKDFIMVNVGDTSPPYSFSHDDDDDNDDEFVVLPMRERVFHRS